MKINKPLIKKIFISLLWMVLGIGFFTLWAFSSIERKKLRCEKINIKIDEGDNKFFVDKSAILKIIKEKNKDTLFQQKINAVNWIGLESAIEANPWIANTEIYSNRNGDVVIDVQQRCPIMRIINNEHLSFYIDENGKPMNWSSTFTARVLIVTGNVSLTDFNYSHPEQSKRNDLVQLVKFINKNEFWKAQIAQIEIKKNEDFVLYPLQGEHEIELGDATDCKEKFDRLKIFYLEGLNKVGWSKYKKVSVKYKGEVVATKNNSTIQKK